MRRLVLVFAAMAVMAAMMAATAMPAFAKIPDPEIRLAPKGLNEKSPNGGLAADKSPAIRTNPEYTVFTPWKPIR